MHLSISFWGLSGVKGSRRGVSICLLVGDRTYFTFWQAGEVLREDARNQRGEEEECVLHFVYSRFASSRDLVL